MGLFTEENFKKFIELRHLIDCKPNDIKELKAELKENYFQQRLNSLSDLRGHMSSEFEGNFFSRKTRKFFGSHKITFSKKEMMVYCIFSDRVASYEVVLRGDYLELVHV